MSPAVTVIVINHNGGNWIIDCLAALRAQSFRDFVTLVVDNASTDGSFERIAAEFPEVEQLRLGINAGFAAGVNRALEKITTPWFALLNPDALPEPDWLQALMSAAQEFPNVAAFGSQLIMYHDPLRLDGIGDAYYLSGRVRRIGHGRRKKPDDDRAREIFSPCAAAALYQTAPVREVGGLDEALFCYLEDVDLGFRLRLNGHRCRYVPQARVAHVGSAIAGKHSDFQTYYGQRNLLRVFVKNMPSLLFWLGLPLHVLLHLVSLPILTCQGRGRAAWRAKRDALRSWSSTWRARRQVQQQRTVSVTAIARHLLWRF